MDDTERTLPDNSDAQPGIGRRALFSRALLAVGATTALLTLTGCPGGEQDDDGEDSGDDGGDDD